MDEKTTGGNSRWPENDTQQHTAADGGGMVVDGGSSRCLLDSGGTKTKGREGEMAESLRER